MRIPRSSTFFLLVALLVGACETTPPSLKPTKDSAPPVRSGRETTLAELAPYLTTKQKDYPLYPGDVIQISVQGHDELTVERKIPENGKVPVYGVRLEKVSGSKQPKQPVTVMAAGKMVPELEADLRKLYGQTITDPYVTVRVVTYAPKTVYIAGAVANPRDYRLPDEERVSLVQALTMAGWFTPNAAQDRVRIIRKDPKTGKRIFLPPIDVGRIISGGEAKMDVLLEPGDTVTVDSKTSRSVSIFGYVETPGDVPWTPDMTLTRLITRAGGLKKYAKLTNIRVIRDQGGKQAMVRVVDLKKVFDGEVPDPPLSPGDVVYVDETFF